jgi:hypothetical protein
MEKFPPIIATEQTWTRVLLPSLPLMAAISTWRHRGSFPPTEGLLWLTVGIFTLSAAFLAVYLSQKITVTKGSVGVSMYCGLSTRIYKADALKVVRACEGRGERRARATLCFNDGWHFRIDDSFVQWPALVAHFKERGLLVWEPAPNPTPLARHLASVYTQLQGLRDLRSLRGK